MSQTPIIYIDGKPECPVCKGGITLKEYAERPTPGKKPKWFLVCPVCEISIPAPQL